MNPEQTPKSPAAKTGFFATLSNLLRGQGSSAPSTSLGTPSPQITKAEQAHLPAGVGPRRRASLGFASVLAIALTALLALSAAPASAFDTHTFKESFGSAGHGDGQFELAPNSGLAVNQTTHNVYLADTGNHRVVEFSEAGAFIRAFGWGVATGASELQTCTATCQAGISGSAPGQLTAPNFIAVDNSAGGEGAVYVADTADNLVTKFSSAGALESGWGNNGATEAHNGQLAGKTQAEPFSEIAGIAVDAEGKLNVIQVDAEPHHLLRFERNGTFKETITIERGNSAAGLAVDPSGDFFKINGSASVEKFHGSGADVGQVSAESAGAPTGLAIDPSSGQLYADVGTKIDNYTFNSSGEVIERPASTCVIEPEIGCNPTSTFGSEKLTAGGALAVDGSTHNVFAVDSAAGKIVVFEPLILPDATTEAATEITRQAATLNGTVGAGGGPGATCTFQYETEAAFQANSESARFTGAATAPCNPAGPFTGSGTTPVSAALSGLSLETTYRFRVLGTSTNGSNPGEALAFTTAPPVTLTTGEATAITGSTATLNGEIDPEGVELEGCFFEYLDDAAFQENLDHGRSGYEGAASESCAESPGEIGSGNAPVPVHADLEGLNGGTIIHFRLAAKNSFGTSQGADATFKALGPSVLSESASAVTATSATLEAELNPHGLPTTYHFEYDTPPYAEGEGPHGTATPNASAGSGTTDVIRSAQLQGLIPETTYHFRVVAENSLGTSLGPDRAFTTQGAAASLLPDGRVWEMVTPPNKNGSPLEPITEEGGVIQASADGSGFAEVALGPLNGESQGVRSPQNNQWLSVRGSGGWSTSDITTPRQEIAIVHAGTPSEYKAFSPDLSISAVEPEGNTLLSPQATETTPYRREVDGTFVPLVTESNVPPGTKFGGSVTFHTTSSDLSHILLSSPRLLTEEFEPTFERNGQPNLYEESAGHLTLVSVLPNGEATSEAELGVGVGAENQGSMRGAISNDGNRVFFEAGQHIFVRDLALGQTLELDQPQEGAPGGGLAQFQAANADGSRVFFTDDSPLTADATARPGKPDLYMCEIGVAAGEPTCALSDLSVPVDPNESADVFGGTPSFGSLSAIDESGEHVYFAADGVLTDTPNARGEVARPGRCIAEEEGVTCNLYEYNTNSHQISLVAVLSSHDDPDWAGRTDLNVLGSLTARSSPNGRWFTFMSQRSLTGYDNRDAASGQRDEEVFLFDSQTGQLSCASCNPTGARPHGVFDKLGFPGLLVDHAGSWGNKNALPRWLAASIPGWTLGPDHVTALYQSRYLSDAARLFFNSADALVPQDTNGVMDVYQYEPPGVGDCTTSQSTYSPTSGGCISLISSGTSSEESAFLDGSETGDDVFFLTKSKLTGTDVDSAFDVYDAAVGGSTHETVKPVECSGDACQQPATPPNHPTPGTALLNGPGNLVQCSKGKVKKSGKCVKQKAKKKHHKKKGHKKQKRAASHNRGGQK